jgi:hypothetical protein
MDFDDENYYPHRCILMQPDLDVLEFSAMVPASIVGILCCICVGIFMFVIENMRSLFMLLCNVRNELQAFAVVHVPLRIRKEEDEDTDIGIGSDDETDVSVDTMVELEEVDPLTGDDDTKVVGDRIRAGDIVDL